MSGNYDLTYEGPEIQDILDAGNTLEADGYIFCGVATPSTNPGTPTEKVYYVAKEAGTYTNFDGVTLPTGLHLLMWNGNWSTKTFFTVDEIEQVYKALSDFPDKFYPAYKWTPYNTSYTTFAWSGNSNNGIITLLQSGGSTTGRISFYIGYLTNGEKYRLRFKSNVSNDGYFQNLGWGNSPTASWSNLLDINGNKVEGNDIDVIFEKSAPKNYIFFSTSEYSEFPTTITITDFGLEEVDSKFDAVEQKINALYGLSIVDKQDMTFLVNNWQTNDSDVWYIDTSVENVITLTNNIQLTRRYVGFNISNIPNGRVVRLRFRCNEITGTDFVGAFNSLEYQSWVSLLDTGGNIVKKDAEGYTDVVFYKTVNINWIVLTSNTFSAGDVITIDNYSLYTYDCLSNAIGRSPISSVIPSNYTWEKLMDIQGTGTTGSGQGSCVYEDYFVNASAANSQGQLSLRLYNLLTKTFIQEVILEGITNVQTHANAISFSGVKYDNSDVFPLLYIPSGYADSNTGDYQIYVYRLIGSLGSQSATKIQTITLKKGTEDEWLDAVCDSENNRLWVRWGVKNYICYEIPSIENSEVEINESTQMLNSFTLPTPVFAFGVTKSSNHGFLYNKGKIWVVSGVPSFTGEGADACYLAVIDVRTGCRETIVWLADVGLTNGTSNVYEPESVFMWNEKLYISYRTFIAEIRKIELV
jgi:hypothetical protein